MWASHVSDAGSRGALRFSVSRKAEPASYADVLEAWRTEADFRKWFNDVLAGSPFSAFRWETPPVTKSTAGLAFEFVLLDSPGLARQPGPEAFAEHLDQAPSSDIVTFSNLGGDAIMVVPRPIAPESAYGHIGAFVRNAPESQRLALWQAVGQAMLDRLGASPVWLSTAGAGVS